MTRDEPSYSVSDEKATPAEAAYQATPVDEVTDMGTWGEAGDDQTAAAPRRGRHRRARSPMFAVLSAFGVVVALATSLALGAGTSEDSTSPAPRSNRTVPQPEETPTFEPSLTPAATPTAPMTSPAPKSKLPTAVDSPPAVAGPVQTPPGEPVESGPTATTDPDQPPGHSDNGPGRKPTAPPGQDRKTPSPGTAP